MRISWMSDSPAAPTGFGNVTRFVCPALARLGHEVSMLAWGRSGRASRWRGCAIHPAGSEAVEAAVLSKQLRTLRPDVLVTLGDPWRVSHLAQPAMRRLL